MLRSGDWSKFPSTDSDAPVTLRLTLACDRVVATGETVAPG